MRSVRMLFVAFVAGLVTLGVPAQLSAAPAFPRALDGVKRVAASFAAGHRMHQRIALPWRANMVYLSFVGPDQNATGVTAELRAHQRGGWSAAQPLEFEADEAADRAEQSTASTRVFSQPVWVGSADAIQLSVRSAGGTPTIGDVRVHAMNTAGDAHDPTVGSVVGNALRWMGRFLSATPAPAEASTSKPTIITRKQWGADESIRGDGPGLAPAVKMVIVHHTDNSNSYSKSESAALVRAIYRYHVLGRDYADIAYNFLVDRYGQIFEGRWGGVDKPVIGAHARGFNTGTTGVSMLGNFTSASPTSAMLTALKRIVAWKMDVHHIPPIGKVTMISGGSSKYDAGTRVSFNRIAAHRDANDTACPGWAGYKKLTWLRYAVAATGLPKIYLPALSSTLLRPDGDGSHESVTFTATNSVTSSWTLTFADAHGTIARTFKGSSKYVNVVWNGTMTGGTTLAPSSRYTWKLTTHDSDGHNAMPATGALYVVTNYPDGSLISDTDGPFVIGSTAQSLTTLTRAARFGSLKAVAAGAGLRDSVPDGLPASLRAGTLLTGSDGTHYIYSDSTLRRFGAETFAALGYQDASAIVVDDATIAGFAPGAPVSDQTAHPSGSVVKDVATGQTWVIGTGTKRAASKLAVASWYRSAEIVTATAQDLALPEGGAFAARVGALVADPDGGAPWVIGTDGAKRRFLNTWLYARLGLPTPTIKGSRADLDALTTGSVFG